MAKKEEVKLTAEQKMIGKVSDFAVKYRVALIAAIAVIVVAIVAAVIVVNVVNGKAEKTQIAVFDLETEYYSMASEENPDWDAFVSKCMTYVKGSSYPSVKAAYLAGLASYQAENYSAAEEYFIMAYNLNDKIYMAPVALANAAACYDAQGNSASALEYYNKIYDDYSDSGVAPKALFNVGRIYYQQGNMQLAKATFEQVADYYPNSEYGALASNLANVL